MTRPLSWLRAGLDYLLNGLAAVVVAGALFWIWPTVISVPYDGVNTYLNVAQKIRWNAPGDPFGMYYPLEGMGARLLPVVVPLLPHLSAFWLTTDPGLQVWLTFVMLAGMLAVSMLAYYRAAGVPRGLAIAAVWFELVLAMTLSDLARSTWAVIFAQVGMAVALALFLVTGRGQRARNVASSIAFVLFIVAFVASDHVFNGYLAGPVLGVALSAHLITAPTRAERLWKLGALVGTGVVIVALGIPQWMVGLAASISRAVFFDEIIAQPQYAQNAGMIFRATDALTIVYALAIIGTLGELMVADRRRRTLASITALLSIGLGLAGLIWLTTDYKWRGPAPAYFNVCVFPWLALMAARGLDHMLRRPTAASQRAVSGRLLPLLAAPVAALVFIGVKYLLGTATILALALIVVIVSLARLARLADASSRTAAPVAYALAIAVVLLTGDSISVENLRLGRWRDPNGVQAVAASEPNFARLLRRQVAIAPGSPFRGYADSVVRDYKGLVFVQPEILAWHMRDIPTLSQYSYYITPAYHAFVTRLLDGTSDRPNVNHVTATRVDTRLLRMLGLRFLMSDSPLSDPELTRVGREGERMLYELRDPNVASFSPTRVQRAADAGGMIALLANPDFDPRIDVVTADDLDVADDLVPAVDSGLTFVQGGIRFSGRSPGRSLVVLPVQYTRCLDVRTLRGSGDVRVRRVNLVETGVLFSGEVEIEGRVRFGGPWERCLQDDLAEIDRLRLRDLVERRRMPEYSFPGPRLRLFGPLGLD